MPQSMTGFGAAEGSVAGGVLRVELKSVNHRYLSLGFKGAQDLAHLETDLRDRLRRDFDRGHFSVTLRWLESPGAEADGPRVDSIGAAAAVARLRELAAATGVEPVLTLELLARQPDVFVSRLPDAPAVEWAAVEPVFAEAMAGVAATRGREGEVLGAELAQRILVIRQKAAAVRDRAPARLVRERDRLRQSVAELLDGRAADDLRLNQEIALLADRLDITEELVRLDAHLDAVETALGSSGPVGKQLGFLAQEMGREVNTIGSKANDAAIQHLVIDMKGELERFREQLENLV